MALNMPFSMHNGRRQSCDRLASLQGDAFPGVRHRLIRCNLRYDCASRAAENRGLSADTRGCSPLATQQVGTSSNRMMTVMVVQHVSVEHAIVARSTAQVRGYYSSDPRCILQGLQRLGPRTGRESLRTRPHSRAASSRRIKWVVCGCLLPATQVRLVPSKRGSAKVALARGTRTDSSRRRRTRG